MESKEKEVLVTTTGMALILGGYATYLYANYIAADVTLLNDFKFWGKAFLVLIPLAIVAQIVIHIVFAILHKMATNEDLHTTMTDERDKLIELKSIQISHWIFVGGFLLAMASQAVGMQVWVMFVTLILAGFVSAVASGIAKIYFYRKGC